MTVNTALQHYVGASLRNGPLRILGGTGATPTLAVLKMVAAEMLNYDDAALAKAIAAGVLTEVTGDDQTVS
jgi:hypothetical protein